MKPGPPELLAADAALVGTLPIRDGDRSMLPLLRPGQVVEVEYFVDRPPDSGPPLRLRRGDLLLFRQSDYLVVHRLIKRARAVAGGPALRTRGDGWNALDPALEPQRIVGRVTALQDEAGWWSLRTAGARLYATCVAWHDLFYAGLGLCAAAGDRVLGRLRLPPILLPSVRLLDRGTLSLAHRLSFRVLHARTSGPGEPRGERGPKV